MFQGTVGCAMLCINQFASMPSLGVVHIHHIFSFTTKVRPCAVYQQMAACSSIFVATSGGNYYQYILSWNWTIPWLFDTHPSMNVLTVIFTLESVDVSVEVNCVCWHLRTSNQLKAIEMLPAWCLFPVRFLRYVSVVGPVLVRLI